MKHIFVITYHRVTNSDNMPYGWVSGKHVNKRNTVSSLPSHFKTVIFFTPLLTIPTSLITLISTSWFRNSVVKNIRFSQRGHHVTKKINAIIQYGNPPPGVVNRGVVSAVFLVSRIHSLFLLCTRDTLISGIHSIFTYLGYTRLNIGSRAGTQVDVPL